MLFKRLRARYDTKMNSNADHKIAEIQDEIASVREYVGFIGADTMFSNAAEKGTIDAIWRIPNKNSSVRRE